MRATLSLLGLWTYDNSVLQEFALPSEWPESVKQDFVNKLMFQTAELSVLYPDPTTMKAAIGFWSRSELPQWEKLYATEHFDYNPIWNKDGVISETETIGRTNQYQDNRKTSGSTSDNGKQNSSQKTSGDENTTEKDYVFGFNSNDAAQSGEIETDGNHSENTSGELTTQNSGTSSANEDLNHSGSDDETRHYERKEQGNIGITTTQQMIREEREVDKFNLMDYIIDRFITRFCIMVY